MEGNNRLLVVVFSGLVFSGKSFFRNWAMGLSEFQNAQTVAMDDIRKLLWGNKSDTDITKTEHIFKNEATRFEVKRRLIIERPPAMFLESVMLTREAHQKPFVEMIDSANWYLQTIEKEEANRDDLPPSKQSIKIDFRCIYLYCNLETVRRRIQYRLRELEVSGNKSNASVFDSEGFLRGAKQIEIPPVHYTPLYINTSDESPHALEKQRQEILLFLRGEMPIGTEEHQRRSDEAVMILNQACKL
ncbi:MAG: hypothetical protein A2831_00625 [Candidatus Yanofskybacteria bacterium RIFCSPHIGHO2_01_FULL_44_17]|uniref:Uncharacterized protein n=1 Tax=Candidatus Yanofskybacteria bacterium RIFCSPHIGHO2_01_FULL_44_17 TaxID=1802668 RepID=A0A1F8EXT7_9BACT|nr:MAG: hypothetical protein A2831_00625 [Candidatus Yanofskybacteria bacterium RIFCSPHIGHO2_01_FULL_44_17]